MSLRRTLAAFALLAGLAGAPAWAVQPDEVLPDPVLEARARALSSELRCLVCQNQSIDDSAAPLARDLRVLVRERLVAGDGDAAVKAYLVSRYGNFILLKPPFGAETLLLWAAPCLVLGLGLGGIWFARRGSGSAVEPAPLAAAEEARLAALTGEPHTG